MDVLTIAAVTAPALHTSGAAAPGKVGAMAWTGRRAQQSVSEGFGGVVAKRLASPYLPGRRTRDWIKIKHPGGVGDVAHGMAPR
ncbi:ATP-dependent DNA ligase [Streptomyces sp. NPDC001514]